MNFLEYLYEERRVLIPAAVVLGVIIFVIVAGNLFDDIRENDTVFCQEHGFDKAVNFIDEEVIRCVNVSRVCFPDRFLRNGSVYCDEVVEE